jgi:ketosteroid isomerase-like protein
VANTGTIEHNPQTMKTTIILFLTVLMAFTIPALTFSQTMYSGEQRNVYTTVLLIGQAWTENNLDTLNKYIDKDYLHTDVRGQTLNKEAWFKYIRERKEQGIKNPGLKFEDIDIRVYGDFAFVTGVNMFTGAAFANDSKDTHKLRFTQVMRKEKQFWKRLLFQATYITN